MGPSADDAHRHAALNHKEENSRHGILSGIPPQFIEDLQRRSGLKPLPVIEANTSPGTAATLFHENGIVAIRGALPDEKLRGLKAKLPIVMAEIVNNDQENLGIRGPLRYSFGGSSSTLAQLHHPEWAALIDVPAVTAVLDEIWGRHQYVCQSGGGDFCLSGAPGHQNLHADAWFPECEKYEVPPRIAVNYLMDDQTPFNGPLRVVPGSHRMDVSLAPKVDNESEESILSTMCPLPAGTALVRDLRAWHGGTPNLANYHRAMPNAEFTALCYLPEDEEKRSRLRKSVPYDVWRGLSVRGRDLARYVVAEQGRDLKQHLEYDFQLGGNFHTHDFFGGFQLAPMFHACLPALNVNCENVSGVYMCTGFDGIVTLNQCGCCGTAHAEGWIDEAFIVQGSQITLSHGDTGIISGAPGQLRIDYSEPEGISWIQVPEQTIRRQNTVANAKSSLENTMLKKGLRLNLTHDEGYGFAGARWIAMSGKTLNSWHYRRCAPQLNFMKSRLDPCCNKYNGIAAWNSLEYVGLAALFMSVCSIMAFAIFRLRLG